MGQPTKREQQLRSLCEAILAELVVMRRVIPVRELRLVQVKQRTGWSGLMDPALDEVKVMNDGIEAIASLVHAELPSLVEPSGRQ